MKILRIANIPDNRTGGMSRTMYCTGDYLIAMGHHVDYLFSQDIQIKAPNLLQKWLAPFQIPGRVNYLAKQGQSYDVIELHEAIAAPYCFARQINKDLPPAVIFSYGLEKRHQLAELAYNTQKELPISLPLRYVRLTVVQSMYALQHCNHVICSNSEDIDYLKQIRISENRLTQHHSGVDPEFLLAGETTVQTNISRSGVLFLGSWIFRKGILDLAVAMTEVMQKHTSLQFTVAGCGRSAATVLAEFSEHLHPRIRIISKLEGNQELIEIYRQHSIFVLPSYFEGQPLVMMEAAAMGLAIVTTNVCGMVDFIEDGINGLTVPVGDVEALTYSLNHLVSSEALIQQFGAAARRKVQTYTWEGAAKKIENAYQKAILDDQST